MITNLIVVDSLSKQTRKKEKNFDVGQLWKSNCTWAWLWWQFIKIWRKIEDYVRPLLHWRHWKDLTIGYEIKEHECGRYEFKMSIIKVE